MSNTHVDRTVIPPRAKPGFAPFGASTHIPAGTVPPIPSAAAPAVAEAASTQEAEQLSQVRQAAEPVTEPPKAADQVVQAIPNNYDYSRKYMELLPTYEEGDIALPSGVREDTLRALGSTANLKLENNPALAKFLSVIGKGVEALPFADGLLNTTTREGSYFRQVVPSSIGDLRGGQPKFKKKEGVKYTGDSARNLLRNTMKMGTTFRIPLWHSGFWLTVRAPGENDLLDLFQTIVREKSSLGRSTYGLLFSNTTVYASKALLDFVMDNLYETSLKVPDNTDLRTLIALPDLSLLIWGLACATWPNGFTFNRGCIADIDACQHIITAKLNLSELLATDLTRLTERQISHMVNLQRGSMTVESVQRYVDDFLVGKEKTYSLAPNVEMVLKMPDVTQHITAGYAWVTSIEERYARAMTLEPEEREQYLMDQAKATTMRQYGHFVKRFIVDGEEIDETADIDLYLNDLSADDTVREKFIEICGEYRDESVVSLVAIPTYDCPSCGKPQKKREEGKPFGELIPLDVAQAFFPLLIQKVGQIRQR